MFEKVFFSLIILFSIYLCCCGSSSNIIFSLISFIGIIVSLAILLLFYNLEFFGLMFLIIYIGAITVIFLFVIFIFNLTNPSNIFKIELPRPKNIFLENILLLILF